MGICKLPVKEDYFPGNRSDMLPQHTAIHLSKSMFNYLLRNFHVSFAPNDEEFLEPEPTVPEEEIQEEVIVKLINDMMLEDMDMDIDNEEEKQHETQEEEEEVEQQAPPHQAWYSTITSFINHVNRVSQKLCKHPGW
jgi:Ser-tRNA(Ala) deacylase AlaX